MEEKIKVRDMREKGWFYLDNEYLNGYASKIGAVGTAIYASLCRHANSHTQECYPSINKIAEELNISRPTVSKHLKKLIEYNIITVEKRRTEKGNFKSSNYFLLDKTEWK